MLQEIAFGKIKKKGIEEEEYRPPLKRENCSPAERQFGGQGTGR